MGGNGSAVNWREIEEIQRAVFRDVNERIASLFSSRFAGPESGPKLQLVCECADVQCTAPVEVTLDEYERIRAEPRRYVIAPNHEDPERETVIARGAGFAVVETLAGNTSKTAENTDPRRRARLAFLRRERADEMGAR